VSASLPVIIRGIVPAIVGYLSMLLFKTTFSNVKIIAVFITFIGISLGCFVQLKYETTTESFKATGFGILVLIFSAFTHAG